LFAELALDGPTLVAHASGGHGALRFAALKPDLLNKLVVINGSPRFMAKPPGTDDRSPQGGA